MTASSPKAWAAAALLSLPLFLLSCGLARAQEPPDQLVKAITEEVIAFVKRDKDVQAGNLRKLIEVVETRVLPHFDFTRMTRIAMAVNWRKATPEQQKALVQEFRTLLVRTYSNALASYRDQAIEFKPLRARPEDTEITVRSEIRSKGGQQPVSLDYDMEKTDAGWKVYDVKVGGVSLITTYREDFVGQVRESGIDGLIKALVARNRQLEAKGRPVIALEGEVLKLEGPVTLYTVPDLLARSGEFGAGVRRIDLAGVTDVDSSAVAFALELCRQARAAGTTIELDNVPEAMRNLARLYGVSALLGIGAE